MNSSREYDAAFAATIAAAAHAIAAREEKLVTQKKPIPIEGVPPAPTPARRAESIKSPTGGRKISRWFSGKEPLEEDDNGPVNVSIKRPLKPTHAKPEDTTLDYKVPPRMTESSLSVKKGSVSFNKSADKKGSKRFEQEAIQNVPSNVRPATSYHSRRNGDTAIVGMGNKTDEWEKAKLTGVREEHQKMMETIAEWENEKKTELDKQRTKVLEEYNKEMSTINKISGGATSMAEERKYNNERKIREKANRMRSTGKLPHTRACF